MEVTGNIYSSSSVGEISMFYQYSSVPPFGYLWCDGSQLNTADDNKYRRLIEVLTGVPKGSTTVDTDISCYLPDFIRKYPLGWNGSFTNYDNSANANEVGNNSLDIN